MIDILQCTMKGYATIENQYRYDSIESLTKGDVEGKRLHIVGKDYMYIVIKPNAEGQKKLLLFVSNRDECMDELQKRLQKK